MRTHPSKIPQENLSSFAKMITQILKSDRGCLVGVSGDPGEGKSCFLDLLCKETAKATGTKYNYKANMTYRRKQLKEWIDGDKDGKGELPEYSSLNADELISMFFSRNWFNADQIDGVELLNKCRDRHLLIGGNIPVLWQLDSAVLPLIRFWIHIPKRGIAWVFQKDSNPWARDKWYCKYNEKLYTKNNHPYYCKGFVCEIDYRDWTPKEKQEYYAFRNEMRKNSEGQREKQERYGDIKRQRDELIRFALNISKERAAAVKKHIEAIKPLKIDYSALEPLQAEITQKDIADLTGTSPTLIGYVMRGER